MGRHVDSYATLVGWRSEWQGGPTGVVKSRVLAVLTAAVLAAFLVGFEVTLRTLSSAVKSAPVRGLPRRRAHDTT